MKFPIIIGKLNMSFEEFYDGFIDDSNMGKYNVSPVFKDVIKKYPPTNYRIEPIFFGDEVSYNLLNVDVAVEKKLLQNSEILNAIWQRVENQKEVNSIEELLQNNIYKVKVLNENGCFSPRILLDESLENNVKDINDEIYLGRQFYKFGFYTYATFIETKANIKTYEEFQGYYGKYVYAVTVEHNNKTLGLTWLDYIMHKPDAHLEFGITSSLGGKRFEEFNDFKKGDLLTITIMADGFKDVVLKLNIKKSPAHKWANMWYKKIVKKRLENKNDEK